MKMNIMKFLSTISSILILIITIPIKAQDVVKIRPVCEFSDTIENTNKNRSHWRWTYG